MGLKDSLTAVLQTIANDIKDLKGTAKQYVLSELANVSINHGSYENRKMLQVKNGVGKIHLDFTYRSTASQAHIFNLPANSPMPESLIEVQTFDGSSIYISPRSRNIFCVGLKNGQRYIVDLFGFFS